MNESLTKHPNGIKPMGEVKFTHPKLGVIEFSYCKNGLNNSMMWQFSNSVSMYSGKMSDIKTILKNIKPFVFS